MFVVCLKGTLLKKGKSEGKLNLTLSNLYYRVTFAIRQQDSIVVNETLYLVAFLGAQHKGSSYVGLNVFFAITLPQLFLQRVCDRLDQQ